jgi:hypothetical protein
VDGARLDRGHERPVAGNRMSASTAAVAVLDVDRSPGVAPVCCAGCAAGDHELPVLLCGLCPCLCHRLPQSQRRAE